jgi:hypothetical protein
MEDTSHGLGRRNRAARVPRQDRICFIMTQSAFLNPSDAVMSTHAGTFAGDRFQVLDSWRGICALLVALFHFPTASAISRSSFIGSSYFSSTSA